MSRRTIVAFVTLLALLLPTPARAITNGTPDAAAHPNVGAVIAIYTPISAAPIVWCSGTLVAPTLFLTAAHCLEEDADPTHLTILGVTFAPVPVDSTGAVVGPIIPVAEGGLHSHPGYPGPSSDPLDIAIIHLAPTQPLEIDPAQLPSVGQFDTLGQKNGLHGQTFTAVGYGSSGRTHEPGSGTPTFVYPDTRMQAVSTFRALNKAWLRLSMNPATGDGGTCYGDSGGPNFVGTSTTIAAITITGDTACRATNVVYRLDSVSAQTFLATFSLVDAPKAKQANTDRDGKKRRGHRH